MKLFHLNLSNSEEDRELIKRWLGELETDDFFFLGGLKQKKTLTNDTIYIGTDDEKAKYQKLQELSYKLFLLDIRTNFLKTFEGMYYIPLAIQNVSAMLDTDIRVVVNVVEGEVINPNEQLIYEESEGIFDYLCRDDDDKNDIGVIAELLIQNEDGNIQYEEEASNYHPYVSSLPIPYRRTKDERDYKQELEEFIASAYNGYYEFNIHSLRPMECKWLPQGILMKPINGSIKLKYHIYSAHSRGDLEGKLALN